MGIPKLALPPFFGRSHIAEIAIHELGLRDKGSAGGVKFRRALSCQPLICALTLEGSNPWQALFRSSAAGLKGAAGRRSIDSDITADLPLPEAANFKSQIYLMSLHHHLAPLRPQLAASNEQDGSSGSKWQTCEECLFSTRAKIQRRRAFRIFRFMHSSFKDLAAIQNLKRRQGSKVCHFPSLIAVVLGSPNSHLSSMERPRFRYGSSACS